MPSTLFAKRGLIADQWVSNLRIAFAGGIITSVTPNAAPEAGDICVDTLLPALANLHSHSFQRAMAGMTEHKVAGRESFWTWRETMYRFLEHLTPDDIEAIAAQVFIEMQEAGYASVGEFHYVHHQKGGAPYADLAELSHRIFAAASATGIGLTHLPVLYTYGGAGMKPMAGGQLRFGNDVARFAKLVEACRSSAKALPHDTIVGIAPHSLRATSPDDLKAVLPLAGKLPVHIHVAEQPKEVEDVFSWLGERPVDWLLANSPVGYNWCLIHATHMTAEETHRLATTGAVAGLCPITEANLGDGPFGGPAWLAAHGKFGIGSDSNVRIALGEELRTLEYSQRLRDLSRNVMVPGQGSTGQWLYTQAATGGAQALGRDAGAIAVGKLADLVAIDSTHDALCGLSENQLLDGWCFAASDDVVTDMWSAGRHQVRSGRHVARDQVSARFRKTMARLRAVM
ncbi:formimidoylglutamate deiminase [Aestuariivirga litoralis]|uniref:formimidoylglutamate deiminase n=1 Tax=Aestuariivirga litoralis TaxID=2650924 RepID=UPI0018C6A142|nr:formimidoylglutamate deiminase [Aestuariivirga litoralis]MBG1232658.1 formimidoylglutamate deiminase [Aestuariivirga litoralis]